MYYLEIKDLANYEEAKNNITKYYNSNCKFKKENEKSLDAYLFTLKMLEEKEENDNEYIRSEIEKKLEDKGVLIKKYISKKLS